jgi:hypothetical protein
MHTRLKLCLHYGIAAVWLANGLFCKVLNLVPRHASIVAHILNTSYSAILTIIIGLLEVIMAIWILSKIKSKLCAVIQIVVVALMNILEFTLVPHLLLWGRFNIIFASIFVAIVYYNQFVLNKKIV